MAGKGKGGFGTNGMGGTDGAGCLAWGAGDAGGHKQEWGWNNASSKGMGPLENLET